MEMDNNVTNLPQLDDWCILMHGPDAVGSD